MIVSRQTRATVVQRMNLAGAAALGLFLAACPSRIEAGTGGTGASTTSTTSTGAGGTGNACPYVAPQPTDSGAVTCQGMLDGASVGETFQTDFGSFSVALGLSVYQQPPCGGGTLLLKPTHAPFPDGGACAAEGASCDTATPCCNDDCNNGTCAGPQADTALFRMPTAGPAGGEWYCAGTVGLTTDAQSGYDITLANVSRLGACPGEPVSGTVTLCADVFGTTGCSGKNSTITSTLTGATFHWNAPLYDSGVSVLGGPYAPAIPIFHLPPDTTDGAGSWLLIEFGGFPDQPMSDGKVKGGVLRLGPGGPDPGAVYCIGGGTAIESPSHVAIFTLTDLFRLGTCADNLVSGSLSVHISE